MKSNKITKIVGAVGTFILLLALCLSGVLFFHSYYYELIYVSGISMSPTLHGGENEGDKADFGIVDTHVSALKHIKRFDIVSTYYPDEGDYNLETNALRAGAKKKIKRVIGLPNETIKIEKGYLYVLKDDKFELVSYPFKVNPKIDTDYMGKDTDPEHPIKLNENQYWVLGDNRSSSRDCASIGKPIEYENLYGVLVAIEGTGSLYVKEYACEICGKTYKSLGNGYCHGTQLKKVLDVKNKQYQWPKYY